MKIEQFEDKGLAQYSYAILSNCTKEIILIDPARDTETYFDYANENDAKIVGVILTHSHADFVSSHSEIQQQTGADIYVSSRMEATFPHQKIDDGNIIQLGKIKLKTIYTPGHSFDSISILLEHDEKDKAIFTGDTLFIGDVGRPDLRGNVDNAEQMRRNLAKAMYHTIHEKYKILAKDIIVYPGHGAGTLCGKSLSTDSQSTIGRELKENYAFEERSEEEFIRILLENQPFIPPYFNYDVALNKSGAPDLQKSLNNIKTFKYIDQINNQELIIDTRQEKEFKLGHLKEALNIQNGLKFETWLGTIVSPDEKFILIAKSDDLLDEVIKKSSKIGYEVNILGTFINNDEANAKSDSFNINEFRQNPSKYTIIDIRNNDEVAHEKIFENSINIPLPELRKKIKNIPLDKPIVVHCAGGYRSSIGSSLLEKELPGVKVFDLSDAIKDFIKVNA